MQQIGDIAEKKSFSEVSDLICCAYFLFFIFTPTTPIRAH